ncbi:MAG: penicillin-binding protein 2 [Lentisphaeria bacterium]|nr:penicillin-binding protein 2 [Lentisphaeria bacterium]
MKRTKVIFWVTIPIWGIAIALKLYDVQVLRHTELETKRTKLTSHHEELTGKRGGIYSFYKRRLASDFTFCKVKGYKPYLKYYYRDGVKEIVDNQKLSEDLHLLFNTPKHTLIRRLNSKSVQVILAKEIEVGLAKVLENKEFDKLDCFKDLYYPNLLNKLTYVKSYRRFYPNNNFLSHVIGFLSFDDFNRSMPVAQSGIEKVWDAELKPKKKGRVSYTKGYEGSVVNNYKVERIQPENGSNIYLTIRSNIQRVIESELKKLVKKYKPKSTYVVMANPKTGAILGMAQYPNYDLNHRTGVTPEEMKNRMLLDYFDPGSTMKGVSIAGAIDEGVVGLNTTFYCENGYWGKYRLKDSHASKKLTVSEIIAQSSNIGTAKIALLLGEERVYSTMHRFGFGQSTNIGLGREGGGLLNKVKNWDGYTITRIPMGQSVSVTAVQMVQAYCTLANDGVMMKLHVVDRVENPNNGEVRVFQAKKKRRVIKSSTAKKITKALALVTKKGGTARRAAMEGIEVAGKTGTSQKVVDGRYSHSKYIASFIGYLPADDPKIVLMVVVDEPVGSHYGGVVAAPTFKAIAEQTLLILGGKPL